MNQRIRIGAGSRVEGSHGPLTTNPNASIKRLMCSKATGALVKAVGPHKWEVVFDYDAKVKTVSSRSSTIVETDAGVPLDEEGNVDIVSNVSIDARDFCHSCRPILPSISFLTERRSVRFNNCVDLCSHDHHFDC